jgi:hypothetical protein
LYLFSSALPILLNFPLICFFCLSRLHFASLNRMTSSPHQSGLARVYCTA